MSHPWEARPPKDVAGGVRVPVQNEAATGAAMNALAQTLGICRPAPGKVLASSVRCDAFHPQTGVFRPVRRLLLYHPPGLCGDDFVQSGIGGHTVGGHSPGHAGDPRLLDGKAVMACAENVHLHSPQWEAVRVRLAVPHRLATTSFESSRVCAAAAVCRPAVPWASAGLWARLPDAFHCVEPLPHFVHGAGPLRIPA